MAPRLGLDSTQIGKGDEMGFTHQYSRIAGFALTAAAMFTTITTTAQTVISNETLVTTTFVVNKTVTTVKCGKRGCTAKTPMLKSIPASCPAALGQTCTFHIAFDAKVALTFPCAEEDCLGPSPTTDYQFLVDGLPPTIGPTDAQGDYLFARNVETYSHTLPLPEFSRQSFPASVIATVTNTNSKNHTIDVNIECTDTNGEGGCEAIARWSTMRVDVFEP
jgi:hypothetical protein